MTFCTPHYPFRRWGQHIARLPKTSGVRVMVRDDDGTVVWRPVVFRPYVRAWCGRDFFFPRCFHRSLPPHRGTRW